MPGACGVDAVRVTRHYIVLDGGMYFIIWAQGNSGACVADNFVLSKPVIVLPVTVQLPPYRYMAYS